MCLYNVFILFYLFYCFYAHGKLAKTGEKDKSCLLING